MHADTFRLGRAPGWAAAVVGELATRGRPGPPPWRVPRPGCPRPDVQDQEFYVLQMLTHPRLAASLLLASRLWAKEFWPGTVHFISHRYEPRPYSPSCTGCTSSTLQPRIGRAPAKVPTPDPPLRMLPGLPPVRS